MNLPKVSAIIFVMALCSSLFSQGISLNLEILNPNAQVFQLGDLDFTRSGLSENYFNIHIQNNTGDTVMAHFEFEVWWSGFPGDWIARGISNDFKLPPGSIPPITSTDLSRGKSIIPGEPPLEITNWDQKIDVVEGLKNQALQTGKAPAGQYNFILTLVDDQGNQFTDGQTIEITNPTYIELLFPGSSVNDPIIHEITTTFPYCQWQTDVRPPATYNIFMYQKYPEDETTQDVLNHPPILHVEGYTNNFLQYPTDTSIDPVFKVVRPLETGRIYYWFVQSIIRSGTGTLTLESDVFRFKIAETGKQAGSAEQILAVLQQILGTRYEQVLRDLREQGFDPNGNLTMDGRNVDLNTLLEIANQISRGEVQIQNVEIY